MKRKSSVFWSGIGARMSFCFLLLLLLVIGICMGLSQYVYLYTQRQNLYDTARQASDSCMASIRARVSEADAYSRLVIYDTQVQEELKDAVRQQGREYEELKRSISQYMDGIVCEEGEEEPAAGKLMTLRKKGFDGRVSEGMELLEELCIQEKEILRSMEAELDKIDGKIQKEDQLIGNILHVKEQRKTLSDNLLQREELQVQLCRREAAYTQAKENSLQCAALEDQIRAERGKVVLFDELEAEEKALLQEEKALADEEARREKLTGDKQQLEEALEGDRQLFRSLETAGEEKARLENRRNDILGRRQLLHRQNQELGQEIVRQRDAEATIGRNRRREEELTAAIRESLERIEAMSGRDALLALGEETGR